MTHKKYLASAYCMQNNTKRPSSWLCFKQQTSSLYYDWGNKTLITVKKAFRKEGTTDADNWGIEDWFDLLNNSDLNGF